MTLYNPHLLTRQELVEAFVARQPVLDELLDDLRRGAKQHHLLVGGRGSGKTTLLLRLAAAIEDDHKLAKQCIALRFPEEQYNVSRLSDLWMNAIDALVDALERHEDRAAAKRVESSLTELEPLEETERAKRSLAVLEAWAKHTRRSIVLLIDNIDLVLDRLSTSLWALREALSIDNRLVVVGASSRFVEEAVDYQSPLYDFFNVHELGPLSEEDARRLVLSLARRATTNRVAEVLKRDPGRFTALYVLTGGTPRTLALLHTVLAHEHSDRIERDLESLLDQLTPYYKARFDDLPAQSQVIVDKVALHWDPITAAECESATHLDVNTVSAQLSRLVKNGLLTKVSLPGVARLGFQLSERFFNIWYLMRASRRLRRKLSWFVEFLRIFYGEENLRRRAEELVRAEPPHHLNSPAKLLAFASTVPDEALRRRLEFRAIGMLADEDVAAIHDAMDLQGEDVHLVPVIDRVRTLRDVRTRIASIKVRWPGGRSSASVAEEVVRHPTWPIALKQQMSTVFTEEKAKDLERAFSTTTEYSAFFGTTTAYSTVLGDRLLSAISTGEVPSLPDVKTSSELRQIVELAQLRATAIALVVIATENRKNPLPDDLVREALLLDPVAAEYIIAVLGTIAKRPHWGRTRHLVLLVVQQTERPIHIAAFLRFFHECIINQLAAEALELFVDAGLTERWAPMHEALRAAAEGSKRRLDGLAPEVRGTAVALYDQLCGSGTSDASQAREGSGDAADHATPRRRGTAKARAAAVATPGRRKQAKRRRPSGTRNRAAIAPIPGTEPWHRSPHVRHCRRGRLC